MTLLVNVSLNLGRIQFLLLLCWIMWLCNVLWLSSGTTVRWWWATGEAVSSAGRWANSRDARLPITGWRTSRWKGVRRVPYVSHSPRDATTAGTAASSSARSKIHFSLGCCSHFIIQWGNRFRYGIDIRLAKKKRFMDRVHYIMLKMSIPKELSFLALSNKYISINTQGIISYKIRTLWTCLLLTSKSCPFV